MANGFKYDVFLSHSSKDKAVVRPLAEQLRAYVLKTGSTHPFDITIWKVKPDNP